MNICVTKHNPSPHPVSPLQDGWNILRVCSALSAVGVWGTLLTLTVYPAQAVGQTVLGVGSPIARGWVAECARLVHRVGRKRLQWEQVVVLVHFVGNVCKSTIEEL